MQCINVNQRFKKLIEFVIFCFFTFMIAALSSGSCRVTELVGVP